MIFSSSGTGLSDYHNFNVKVDRKGEIYNWLEANTEKSDLIAGHPSHIDEIQLLAKRIAFVTTETAHPFYTGYLKEISRTNGNSLEKLLRNKFRRILSAT